MFQIKNAGGLRPRKVIKYSSSLRLWHWTNTIVISGSLLTVLVNSTITENSATASLLAESFRKSGAIISEQSVKSAAQAIADSFWFLHVYFGYSLTALLIFRLLLELFQIADQKLIVRIRTAYLNFYVIKKSRKTARHDFIVKSLYAAFYFLLFTMASTGLFIGYGGYFSFYDSIINVVRKVHGFGLYLILTFIAVHIVGVYVAERSKSTGIVSDMINGGDLES